MEDIKRASQDLAVDSQKIGEILYKQAEGQKPKDESPNEPNVKDAEFEEKKDDDKDK